MNNIATEYLATYGTRTIAAYALGKDLMRGDKATFKAGYTAENAAIAAQGMFSLSPDEYTETLEDLQGWAKEQENAS